jgi:hypothetical protein
MSSSPWVEYLDELAHFVDAAQAAMTNGDGHEALALRYPRPAVALPSDLVSTARILSERLEATMKEATTRREDLAGRLWNLDQRERLAGRLRSVSEHL